MTKMFIKNGTLINPEGSLKADLLIQDGKIMEMRTFAAGELPENDQVIDAEGCWILPGGIDPHVHLSLPTPAGNSSDDFLSGSRAALAGGTTTLFDFVTPRRGQSLHEALVKRRQESERSLCPCHLHMGISDWNSAIAKEIVPLIKSQGITSFKAYLAYQETIGITPSALKELMTIVAPTGATVMVHCEDGEIIGKACKVLLSEFKTRPFYHARARMAEAETGAISTVIELSAQTSCPVYIVHVSTGEGARRISDARQSGIQVYAETCPHYLLLDDSRYGAEIPDREVLPYIMSPPLRTPEDQSALWKGLNDGTFDVVATDHCPFNTCGQKDIGLKDFTRIPNGVGGIEYRTRLLYTYGVLQGRISLEKMVYLTSSGPAKIFGLSQSKGRLAPGFDADIVLLNPDFEEVISTKNQVQNCDANIYEGMTLRGRLTTL